MIFIGQSSFHHAFNRLAKLDTERAQATAAQYRIQSIPTLALFRNGREVARQPGAMGVRDIVRWVRSNL